MIMTRQKLERMLETVPGPCPWYFRSNAPNIPNHVWVEANNSTGAFFLKKGEDVVLILGMYSYAACLDENHLLVWFQTYSKDLPTNPVHLTIIDLTKLQSLNCEDLLERIKVQSVLYNTSFVQEFNLPTLTVNEKIMFSFPPILKHIDELLILCHSSGIICQREYTNNAGLMIVRPSADYYKIYPQNWFNESNCDFGYQWISRVGRNRKNGEVFGDGIRLSPFVLDKTLTRLKKIYNRPRSAAMKTKNAAWVWLVWLLLILLFVIINNILT